MNTACISGPLYTVGLILKDDLCHKLYATEGYCPSNLVYPPGFTLWPCSGEMPSLVLFHCHAYAFCLQVTVDVVQGLTFFALTNLDASDSCC